MKSKNSFYIKNTANNMKKIGVQHNEHTFLFQITPTSKPTGNTIKMTNSMLHYNRMNGEAWNKLY